MCAVLNLAMLSVCACRPKERTLQTLALIHAPAVTAQKDVKYQFAYSVGLYLTDFLCRQSTCEMDRDFCLALERGFSCEVLERRIDLFTSPSNTELVQLELELMGDLGVSTCTKLKITNQLRLTLYG